MERNQEAIKREIEAFVMAHQKEMVEDLKGLVRIPSVQDGEDKEACVKMMRYGATLFKKAGLRTKITSKYVLGEYGEGAKSIGVFAHGDVVPPGDGWLFTKPFSPTMVDGHIIGRGCCDNKAAVVEMLYAVRAIQTLSLPVKSRLVLFLGSEEETGMADIEMFSKKETMPTVSIVPDGNYPYVYGEKGRMVITIKSDVPFTDILEISGGTAENCMLAACRICLSVPEEEKKDISKICEAEITWDEAGRGIIFAKGATAHAAHPEAGKNALAEVAKKLSACRALSLKDRRILKEAALFVGDSFGQGLGIMQSDRTFGSLTCVNSIAKTDNGHLELTFDLRFGGNPTAEILEKVEALEGWSIKKADISLGYNHGEENLIGKALGEAYHAFTGEDGRGQTMGGGTYARHLENAFPVGVAVGGEGVEGFPKGHGDIHGPDEGISISGFLDATKLLVQMILALDKVL